MTGESPPRSTWATAAPQAPVPVDSVSPTPRSKIRARIAPGASSVHQRDVRAVGEQRRVLDRRAERREVERVELVDARRRGSRTAGCRSRRAGSASRARRLDRRRGRPAPPREVRASAARARPMSTRQVVGTGDRRADLARGGLDRERVGVASSRARRRYRIASRAPLPDSSASEPSGLKIRRRATKPGSSGGESSSTPSAPRPEVRVAEAAHDRRGQRERQAARARRSGSRCPAPATSRSAWRGPYDACRRVARISAATSSGVAAGDVDQLRRRAACAST